MSPAETLTAAADRLEALLADVPRGPWHVELGERGYPQNVCNDGGLLIAETYTGPEVDPAEARYIAAMDPVVGRAVVALLRHSAARVRINPDALIDMELILARTILGEAAS